jgi:hypothetical protein
MPNSHTEMSTGFIIILEIILYKYIIYLTCWTNFRSKSPTPKHGENFTSVYVCKHFSTYIPTTSWYKSFRFLSVGKLENSSVFCSKWKWRDCSPTNFLCLSNPSQPLRDLWRGATVNGQTCPCVHWFRWRMFWAFVTQQLLHWERVFQMYYVSCK